MIEDSRPIRTEQQTDFSRRAALARLGLAAGVTTYMAPLLTNLSQASAQVCPPGQMRSMGTCK
jgi:hypothetical protein